MPLNSRLSCFGVVFFPPLVPFAISSTCVSPLLSSPCGRTTCGIFRMKLKCNSVSRNGFRNFFVRNYHSAFHTAPRGYSLLKDLTSWWTTSIYSTRSAYTGSMYRAAQPHRGCWDCSLQKNQEWRFVRRVLFSDIFSATFSSIFKFVHISLLVQAKWLNLSDGSVSFNQRFLII